MPQRQISKDGESVLNGNGICYVPLIRKIERRIESCDPFFSIEFFPPKTKQGANNLTSSFDCFRQLGPLFADITWHSAGNPEQESETSSITIASVSLNYCGLNTMLHLTCVGMKFDRLRSVLEKAKELGIRNILALRGDKVQEQMDSDFTYASCLIKFIRQHYGSYFTIAVAGYPTQHPESSCKEDDLKYLKEKIDAGADFIITQLFFEAETYLKFVDDCRAVGITCPILPGIMPIQNYDSLAKIAHMSNLIIPAKILDDLKPLKSNDEAVRNYGIDWTIRLCRELLNSDNSIVPGIHFYTLNRKQATVTIVKALGLGAACPVKSLPWTPHTANHRRVSETVRPIFWSTNPKSYIHRTNKWDEFPNGRWGNATSPSYGDLSNYYLFLEPQKSKEELLPMYGHQLNSERDVWEVFYSYISKTQNRYGHLVTSTPWNNEELRSESLIILNELADLNKRGILTINSQPNVNGISSADSVFGWGTSDGYIYQKAYLEFFISPQMMQPLLDVLETKYHTRVNYQIINQRGDEFYTNCAENEPIAVTWGVFPGKEILQPTIVDVLSFRVWKDEAFSMWMTKWAHIYSESDPSHKLIKSIHDNYYLVNLVDNDFPKDTCLWRLLREVLTH